MRYALRNQDKIENAFPGLTKSIIASLDKAFSGSRDMQVEAEKHEKYPIILIDDTGHPTGMIAFYIIKTRYDVYHLAFKEFINQ